MPAYPRKQIVDPTQVAVYHCIARCVRRAFLCGTDDLSGKCFEHRKDWIERRLAHLARAFAIDVCSYAVMSNHLHLVLRTRPDLAATLSAEEVARRWWAVFPRRRDPDGHPAEPTAAELAELTADKGRLAELRRRLAGLSWFMRTLCEKIARRANREDQCTGRFWEGRFKCQALLDEAAILACSMYVDLNPIRAGIAPTPEASDHTSAQRRIRAQAKRRQHRKSTATSGSSSGPRRLAWLCPLSLFPAERRARAGEPAGRKGFLSMSLASYLQLLDWTGRELQAGKRGAIPADLAPILERLGLNGDGWVETVRDFGRLFHRAAGRPDHLAAKATAAGQHWFVGMRRSREVFALRVTGS